jgi:hypothetical protein
MAKIPMIAKAIGSNPNLIASGAKIGTVNKIIDTESINIPNINHTATINAMAPNNLMLNGTSFAVGGFTRQYSALVNGQLLNQEAKSSYSDTLVQYTQSIDS